jgi:hypothetical protein
MPTFGKELPRPMKINLNELQSAVNTALTHLREINRISEIEIEDVGYWQVIDEHLYDITRDSSHVDHTIGSLEDDWEFSRTLLEDDAAPVSYQLTEIAPLIYALGYAAAKKGLL